MADSNSTLEASAASSTCMGEDQFLSSTLFERRRRRCDSADSKLTAGDTRPKAASSERASFHDVTLASSCSVRLASPGHPAASSQSLMKRLQPANSFVSV